MNSSTLTPAIFSARTASLPDTIGTLGIRQLEPRDLRRPQVRPRKRLKISLRCLAQVRQRFFLSLSLRRYSKLRALRNKQLGLVIGIDHGRELDHAGNLAADRAANNRELPTHG